VAFLANSFVFLLIGLQVNIPTLLAAWQPVLAAIAAVLVARAAVIYGLGFVTNRLTEPIPIRWLHVMNWGACVGNCSGAGVELAGCARPDRELIRVMAFGVVLFTLLAQSTTMGALIRRLGIVMPDPLQAEYELRQARLLSFRSAAAHLDRMHQDGLLSAHVWETLRPRSGLALRRWRRPCAIFSWPIQRFLMRSSSGPGANSCGAAGCAPWLAPRWRDFGRGL